MLPEDDEIDRPCIETMRSGMAYGNSGLLFSRKLKVKRDKNGGWMEKEKEKSEKLGRFSRDLNALASFIADGSNSNNGWLDAYIAV